MILKNLLFLSYLKRTKVFINININNSIIKLCDNELKNLKKKVNFLNENTPYFNRINLINRNYIRYQKFKKRRIYEKANIPKINWS